MPLRQSLLAASVLLLAACAAPAKAPPSVLGSAADLSPDGPAGVIRAVPMPAKPLDARKSLQRIIVASCADQKEDQSLWDVMAGENPDLVLFIGDNVYGDVRSNDPSLPELKAAYMRLAMSEPFARIRAAAPMLTVWDDHDYGLNDAGGDYRFKEQSEALFHHVWAVPSTDPRRSRAGVYGSWTFGDSGRRVQVIMLDTRYFRSPLKATDEFGARGKERYVPDADPTKTMLGEDQWAWLADELRKPADLRLLVSSIQVIADGHGFEAWRTLPLERERLYRMIDEAGARNVVMLSGDRHLAALYQRDDVIGAPLVEMTASSVNLPQSRWRAQSGDTYIEPGPYRLGGVMFDANYGVVEIDWEAKEVLLSIRDERGAAVLAKTAAFGARQ